VKITINNKDYNVIIPTTEQEKREGLSPLTSIKRSNGMMFIVDSGKESTVTMNTAEMQFTINMLFVGADKVIKEVYLATPGKNIITRANVAYVIELHEQEAEDSKGSEVIMDVDNIESRKGGSGPVGDVEEEKGNILVSGIKTPDKLKDKFETGGTIDIKTNSVDILPEAMQVLDDKGNVLMNIFGGERIFSIKHTKQIIGLARKIKDGDEEPEKLGRLMEDIIETHKTQEPQYTN